MPAMLNASQMLDRCHLEMRHRVLDLASALDRVQSAPGDDVPADDSRMATLNKALAILADGGGCKAVRIQMAYSDPYDQGWRE